MDPMALGRYLAESREAKELTLEQAVSALRIRRGILESFERGDFNVAESEVQVRGLLRNYARYLDLDEGMILNYYEAALHGNPRRRGLFRRGRDADDEVPVPVAPKRITDTPPSLPAVEIRDVRAERRRGVLSMLLQGIIGLAALLVIVYVTVELVRTPEVAPTPQPTQIAGALSGAGDGSPTATYTATWTPQPVPPTDTPDFGFFSSGLLIDVELLQRSWMRIETDGVQQFAGIAAAGEMIRSEASRQIALTVANAAAVRVTFNGQELAPLGVRGQQVDVVFSPEGVDVQAAEGGLQPTTQATDTLLPPTSTETLTPPAVISPVVSGPTPTPLVFRGTPLVSAPIGGGGQGTPVVASLTPDSASTPGAQPTQAAGQPAPASPVAPAATDLPSPTPSSTPSPTPSPTPTLTLTPTGIPSPTAILPPRETAVGLPTAKP